MELEDESPEIPECSLQLLAFHARSVVEFTSSCTALSFGAVPGYVLGVRGPTLIALLAAALVLPVRADAPPRSIALPSDVVDDEFIGYLFALLHEDVEASISGDSLRLLFPEYEDDQVTPMDFINLLERTAGAGDRSIRLEFAHRVEHPAPIDILGHKPVMLYSTPILRFREVYVPDLVPDRPRAGSAYVLYLEEGDLSVDFAGWLDFLLGSIVDDVDVRVVLAISFEGRWYGALAGWNPEGEVVTSVYDMPRGRFLARPPHSVSSFAAGRLIEEPR